MFTVYGSSLFASTVQRNAKQILDEEENFFRNIYKSKNTALETDNSKHFFESVDLKTLENEEAGCCQGLITIRECADVLNKFQNKTLGSDGLTIEFYRCVWKVLRHLMVALITHASMVSYPSPNG